MSLTNELARRAVNLQLDGVADADVERARHSILDWVCATVVGGSSEPGRRVQATLPAGDEATVLGTRLRAAARDAALANGVAAHALELDDVARWLGGHPSVSICSAAFALAERNAAPGAELIAAVLVGYDVACRVSLALGPGHRGAGWHATGTVGTFGAAAACSRLLALPAESVTHTLGLAATQAAGLNASIGTAGKSLHAGKAAADGMLAALLAAEGARGAAEAVERYAAAATSTFDPGRPAVEMGEQLGIRSATFKRHACCGIAQPTVDAVLRLRAEHGLDAAQVQRVEVGVGRHVLGICRYNDPQDELEAKFSIPFAAAVGLADVGTGPEAFSGDSIAHPQLVALRELVTVQEHDHGATVVALELADGRRVETAEPQESPATDAELPAQWERLTAKLGALVTPLLGSGAVDEVVAAVRTLREAEGVERLARAAVPQ